jgi:hypothetical protein
MTAAHSLNETCKRSITVEWFFHKDNEFSWKPRKWSLKSCSVGRHRHIRSFASALKIFEGLKGKVWPGVKISRERLTKSFLITGTASALSEY